MPEVAICAIRSALPSFSHQRNRTMKTNEERGEAKKEFPPCAKNDKEKPRRRRTAKPRTEIVRFSVLSGPASLFARIRQVVDHTTYSDRNIRMRRRHDWSVVPDPYRFFSDIAWVPSAWNLVGGEVRSDTGRFVRSHWNLYHRDVWYRLVLDGRGRIYTLKPLPNPTAPPFRHVVTSGPLWVHVANVNQDLLKEKK